MHIPLEALCVFLETNDVYFLLNSTFPQGCGERAALPQQEKETLTFHYGMEQLAAVLVM